MSDVAIYISRDLKHWLTEQPDMWAMEVKILKTVYRRLDKRGYDALAAHMQTQPPGIKKDTFANIKAMVEFYQLF